MKVLLVDTTAQIRWRISRAVPLLLDAKLGRYKIVNPVVIDGLGFPLGNAPRGRSGSVLIPSEDEVVFSTQGICLALPADARDRFDFEEVSDLISEFVAWIRFLSFQHQIPSVPGVPGVTGPVDQPDTLPEFPDVSDANKAGCLAYLVECCVTDAIAIKAATRVAEGDQVPVHHHLLIDAFSAYTSKDYRLCFLYLAVASESLAANRLEEEYAERMDGREGPEMRVIELPQAGEKTVRKDPVYESLSHRTEFSSLLHERPLYLMGKSLLDDAPETYRLARMLYSTRNKIVHRGELSEEDADRCFSLNQRDAATALQCVADIFEWFGAERPNFPSQRPIDLKAVKWGTRSAI